MSKRLEEKAMLVKLSIGYWNARKTDNQISEEVATMKKADKNEAGNYRKALIEREAVNAIKQVRGSARAFFFEQTLPWLDDGVRILPSKNYDNFMKKEREFRETFEKKVREFQRNYPDLIKRAKKILGDMFNEADYPTPSELARKYHFSVDISPIPVANDFRVNLTSGDIDRIKKEIEQRLKEAQAAAMKDLWERLHDVVEKMAEKMKDKDAIFRDTLISNMCELTELLPALNIAEDPKLEEMRRVIEKKLCTYDPQTLRDDEKERQRAAKSADSILKDIDAAMAGYMGGK